MTGSRHGAFVDSRVRPEAQPLEWAHLTRDQRRARHRAALLAGGVRPDAAAPVRAAFERAVPVPAHRPAPPFERRADRRRAWQREDQRPHLGARGVEAAARQPERPAGVRARLARRLAGEATPAAGLRSKAPVRCDRGCDPWSRPSVRFSPAPRAGSGRTRIGWSRGWSSRSHSRNGWPAGTFVILPSRVFARTSLLPRSFVSGPRRATVPPAERSLAFGSAALTF